MAQLTEDVVASDHDAFPHFTEAEIKIVFEAGERREYGPGEVIIEAGTRNYDCHFIASGHVRVVDVSTDEEQEVVVHSSGQFIGDLDLLTGRPGVVSIIAQDDVMTACIPFDGIRSFLVRHPTIGDRMVSAFLKRRKILSETKFEGIRIYGHKDCGETLQIQEFFYRNGVPNTWKNIEDEDERSRLDAMEISCAELPLLMYGNKEIFRKPTLAQLAQLTYLGLARNQVPKEMAKAVFPALVDALPALRQIDASCNNTGNAALNVARFKARGIVNGPLAPVWQCRVE